MLSSSSETPKHLDSGPAWGPVGELLLQQPVRFTCQGLYTLVSVIPCETRSESRGILITASYRDMWPEGY